MEMSGKLNILGSDPRPSFFAVAGGESQIAAPEPRLGQSVRFAARSLSVMQKEGLATSSGGKIWRLVSDEGAYLDGFNEAPCPLSFLTTGMVCSYMTEILALAEMRGIVLRDIRLIQDNYYTMKGSALKGTMTGGAKDIGLIAEMDSDAGEDELRALVLDGVAASPLNGLMRGEKESLFSLSHNGVAVAPDKAIPIIGPVVGETLDEPSAAVDGIVPDGDGWGGLIRRAGLTPKTDEATSSQSSSLAENQDRTLHIRGICTLRDDGVKLVEQQLFNPHGSIFHYQCDEQGRAPDAASYIAAGIGFCFMTQLGRYAKIAKKDLSAYNVVQDIHFSAGGASGKTGKAGCADPVETHVFLESGEGDDFALAALDMGEQTCFLHAFCRTDLKAKVTIKRL